MEKLSATDNFLIQSEKESRGGIMGLEMMIWSLKTSIIGTFM